MAKNPPPPREDVGGLHHGWPWYYAILFGLLPIAIITVGTLCLFVFLGVWP